MVDIFILIVVMVSEMYTYPNAHFKYVQLIVCQSYVSNAAKNLSLLKLHTKLVKRVICEFYHNKTDLKNLKVTDMVRKKPERSPISSDKLEFLRL